MFDKSASKKISIHAPTRGATFPINQQMISVTDFNPRSHEGSDFGKISFQVYSSISIHAPTRGATQRMSYISSIMPYFNPRSHEGSDERTGIFFDKEEYISIHAPTRGATMVLRAPVNSYIFQSTLPRGERLIDAIYLSILLLFQSTLPRGERRYNQDLSARCR